MKHVDDIRGFERAILFEPRNLYKTSGGVPLTNCVVEVVESDWQGNCPVLSLRFYHKPTYSAEQAQRMAEGGNAPYDEQTPIGTEINLGPEIAQSLIEQIQAQWPQYLKTVNEQAVDE